MFVRFGEKPLTSSNSELIGARRWKNEQFLKILTGKNTGNLSTRARCHDDAILFFTSINKRKDELRRISRNRTGNWEVSCLDTHLQALQDFRVYVFVYIDPVLSALSSITIPFVLIYLASMSTWKADKLSERSVPGDKLASECQVQTQEVRLWAGSWRTEERSENPFSRHIPHDQRAQRTNDTHTHTQDTHTQYTHNTHTVYTQHTHTQYTHTHTYTVYTHTIHTYTHSTHTAYTHTVYTHTFTVYTHTHTHSIHTCSVQTLCTHTHAVYTHTHTPHLE